MTIPGRGDLSPRRKHRNWRRRFAVVGVVALVAGVGYVGYRHFAGHSSRAATLLVPCPSAAPSPPAAQQARLTVRNATLKTGLAAQVAHQLRQRHFQIGKVGNTLVRGKGIATVQYSADRVESARLVAAQLTGATMTEVPGSHVLELDIGPKYRGLTPAAQAQAADRAILVTASASPLATSGTLPLATSGTLPLATSGTLPLATSGTLSSPTPSPTCTPHKVIR